MVLWLMLLVPMPVQVARVGACKHKCRSLSPNGGGGEKGGPTRAQPYAFFMRTPEDTHLPVGGVRRARSDLVAS